MTCGIYRILNSHSGKMYIGSSKNVEGRWNIHEGSLICGNHHNRYLQRAFDKHIDDDFIFELMLICDECMLLYYEQLLIDNLNPEYNIAKNASSPMLGRKHSIESKYRMSVKQRLRNNNYGAHHPLRGRTSPRRGVVLSDITKEKISKNHANFNGTDNPFYGKVHSEESKNKISANHADFSGENHPLFGMHLSAEHRKHISDSKKGKLCGRDNPMFGKTMSEEGKRKVAESNKRRALINMEII